MARGDVNTLVLKKGETAFDILDRAVKRRKKDVAKKRMFGFRFSEFSPEKSFDIQGRAVSSAHVDYSSSDIDALSSKNAEKSEKHMVYLASGLELRIGAPALVYPEVERSKIKPRDKTQVEQRLKKWRNRASNEMKALREICSDIDECQNETVVSAIDTLHWVLTQYTKDGINQIGMSNILDKLFRLIVRRERDKLFYHRRHKHVPSLHKCQDEKILSAIEQIEWVLGENPFRKPFSKIQQTYYDKGYDFRGISSF